MKKKKFLAAAVFIAAAAVALTGILNLLGFGRQYIDKENKITAAVTDLNTVFSQQDSTDVFEVKLEEMVSYFNENGINTAIIPFNKQNAAVGEIAGYSYNFTDASFAENKDILQAVKKSLEKAKIQIILSIDCTDLSVEQLQQTVTEINKKYAFAGVMLENYTQDYSFLQMLKMNINKRWRNYYFGIKLDSIENAKELQSFGAMDFYIFDNITGKEYQQAKKQEFSNETILLDHNSENFLSELFVLSNFGGYDGVVLTEYSNPEVDLSLCHNIMDTSEQLQRFDFAIDSTFNVIYPSKDIDTYYSTIYITGTADPAQPVIVNGNEIIPAQDGTFGYYIELAEGENLIEVQQADNYISRTVNKKSYSYTGSSSTKKESDDTKKAKYGQVIQTTEALTSALVVPDDDSRITDGLQQGVQMVVEKSVKTERDGKYTWAYQLSNGTYVLAKNVEWVEEEDYTPATVNAYGIENYEQDGYYLITLGMSGKPGIISAFDEEKIQLTMLNTEISEIFNDVLVEEEEEYVLYSDKQNGIYFSAVQDGKNVVLTIPDITEDGFWGYNIEYIDAPEDSIQNNVIEIYVKKTPHKSYGETPLKDITIVLDAGHGGTDPGALPLGGINGPGEQDINLAIAQATKICLEKLGAEVHLTRSDDTYLTLQERRDITNSIKPDLFISMHHNSMEYTIDASQVWGFESYYFSPQSKPVAERMAYRVSNATDRKNRGHHFGYYYVLRNDIAPCVLNEYGFLINPYEYSTLYSDENIYKAAMGTALAVLDVIPE